MRGDVAGIRSNGRSPGGPQLGGGALEGPAIDVEYAERPAIPGQQLGHRQAESARGAGDEGAL
jgi:hypothetical protein